MKSSDAIYREALEQLQQLIDEAIAQGLDEPHAAALATADRNARPSVRMVYVTAVEPQGLLLFANIESGKGHQLIDNPRAALCFFWRALQVQVTLEGEVILQSAETADRYWHRRSREAQLATWASQQGTPALKKGELRQKARQLEQALGFEAVPRHADWCAFRILPERIEFWPSGWPRMRERISYRKDAQGQWFQEALNP